MEKGEASSVNLKGSKMEKTITMPKVSARKFYRQYIELLQPILKLRSREADVFSELLYHNYTKRSITDDKDRFRLVFDISTREQIQEHLQVSNPVIQQALAGLRRKNVIKGTKLREAFTIEPEEGVFELTFKFVIDE